MQPDETLVPIASAPKAAAAQRPLSFNASRLSMIRPLFDRPGASFGALLSGSVSDKGFRMFASKAQNDFVRQGIVSSRCREEENLKQARRYFSLFRKGRGNSLWDFS